MVFRKSKSRWRQLVPNVGWRAIAVGVLVSALGLAAAGEVLAAERYEFTKKKMGADFTLTFYADDQEAANQAAAAAYRAGRRAEHDLQRL